ncbi:MAG: AAA family ATPase [bacterium]
MIITISGLPGSGKSTLTRALAKKLNYPSYSMGDLRRQKAEKRGMSIAEFNKLGETDPSTDSEVDEYQEKLGKTKDNFIIEGRTSWHFIPQSFKIFLIVNPRIGAERILKDIEGRNEGDGLKTIDDIVLSNQQRVDSDKIRYEKYFQINAYDESNYDYILDTSNLNIEQMIEAAYARIVQELKI